jgi:predicted nucleotidyltransferase
LNITKYPEIKNLVKDFSLRVQEILKENVVGIYLTGSISYGDFILERSDIDLLVVVKDKLNSSEIELVKILHKDIEEKYPSRKDRIECSYTPIYMLNEIFPPIEPRPWIGSGVLYPEAPYGNEWIINSYLLQEYGISIFGKAYKELLIKPIDILEVQKACVRDIFKEIEPKIRNNEELYDSHIQSYTVLNICRILYTVFNAKVGSKVVSAKWVKEVFAPEWSNLITKSENWKYGEDLNSIEEVVEFIKFSISKIKEAEIYRLI